jgi:hemolysin activation/secretion protein
MVKLEPFYDYGYISSQKYQKSGSLAGAGIKGIFLGKYFNASLTYSWVINQSGLSFANEKENKMLYFELSAKCC